MSKKHIETPQKSPRFGEGTSNDDVHVSNFNILTQPPPPPPLPQPKIVENPATDGSSKLKEQQREKNEEKKGHPCKSKGQEDEGENC
ncbi:hypothetical protein H5410_023153 [Solanum commersonii]|uniref:Uncharacterized protein n=1 Tax=Solanum commersonii TaxID=4109 RepID=A0A9J5ZIW0_SOLCO|nr:hypothetical protein H5410_023153 [Solanum commersonii]